MHTILRSVRAFLFLCLLSIMEALTPLLNASRSLLNEPVFHKRRAVVLRKVRGVSGSTALFRDVDTNGFGGGGSLVGSMASVGAGLVVALVVAAAFLIFAAQAHAAPVGHSAPLMGFTSAFATKLREKESQLAAKQKALHDVFEKSGPTRDFNNPEFLVLIGAKDSAEAVEKVKAMTLELDVIGKERDDIADMKRIDEQQERFREPVKGLPHPTDDENEPGRRKSRGLGEVIVNSLAFKEARRSLGLQKSDREAMARQGLASMEDGFSLKELKAAFVTTAGWAPESTRIPGLVIEKATRPIQIIDIIPDASTDMAAVKYMEETTRTHAGAERAENAAYAESAFALTERSETVRSIGESVPVTDEQLEDVAGSQSYLEQRLMFGCRQRLDGQILIGDGNAPNLTGIKNKAGIQTQAKGVDPAPDAIYKAMTLVRVTGRAFPNAVIIHPNNWQTIRLLRTADGIYIWGSPSDTGIDRIWGIQAVQSDADAAGTAYVGDYANFCALYERKGIEVAIGYVNADFLNGRRTIRAGLRVAFAIYRAAAFCTVTGLL